MRWIIVVVVGVAKFWFKFDSFLIWYRHHMLNVRVECALNVEVIRSMLHNKDSHRIYLNSSDKLITAELGSSSVP